VHGWLAVDPARRVELSAVSAGLVVRVVDGKGGERATEIGVHEEPSAAAWRTIILLDRG
jgi:hypothetical protein